MRILLKLLRHPTDHLEGYVTLVAVLVFFVRLDQGEITGFQWLLLAFLVHQGTASLDDVNHVHYNSPMMPLIISCNLNVHFILLHKPHPGIVLKRYQIDLIIQELNSKNLV